MSRVGRFKPLWLTLPIMAVVAIVMAVALPAMTTKGADHLDAPMVSLDGRVDINDVYIFQSPENNNNTTMIMTVNPAAGVNSPTTFSPNVSYEFVIDTNFDNRDDFVYKVNFGQARPNGEQSVSAKRVDVATGQTTTIAKGDVGEDISTSEGRITADIFDDPFYFDLIAFQNGAAFCPGGTGTDFFAGLNVSAMVLEVPNNKLPAQFFNIYSRTKLNGVQIDRMGRPAINTVFIPSSPLSPGDNNILKNVFNMTQPGRDRDSFKNDLKSVLEQFYNDDTIIDGIAGFLLPDVNFYDTTSPSGFPNSQGFLNGRTLEDDVIDAELALITNNAVNTDCVDDNDKQFLNDFPYLASPHSGNP